MGRPPTQKRPQPGRQYVQAVKQREHGRIVGVELQIIFCDPVKTLELLGQGTSYIERTHLTMRLFNSRLVRKTLAFSKEVGMYRAPVAWEDLVYNLTRPLKTLRLPSLGNPNRRWRQRYPTMASGLTDHIWTVKELLKTVVPTTQQHLTGDYLKCQLWQCHDLLLPVDPSSSFKSPTFSLFRNNVLVK